MTVDPNKLDYLKAAAYLAEERVKYAEQFLRFRVKAPSDGYAHQQAIVETKDMVTLAEAQLEIARRNLHRRRS